MRQYTLLTRADGGGVEASVPAFGECACWARTEDAAVAGVLERVAFFLSLPKSFKHRLDLARKEEGGKRYVLIVRE